MYRRLAFFLDAVATLRALPGIARQRRVVAYEVRGPTTVYVRASHCRVTVRRTGMQQVQVEGELRQAFGWQWVTERDEAGVYVILKRKPLVGALSYAELSLTVPLDAYLVFHLTPGSVHLQDFSGRLSIAPLGGAALKEAVERGDSGVGTAG